MKSLSVKLGVVLIGLAIFGYAKVWGQDWVLLQEVDVTHSPSKIVKVWIEQVYTQEVSFLGSLVLYFFHLTVGTTLALQIYITLVLKQLDS